MALLPGRKLGSRTLRLGHKGPDVDQLHEFLRLQGYDLGAEQSFGYLTKDAVRKWQRDHGLVADGIAGKRFFALALQEKLPIRRRIHVAGPTETLTQIATDYGVGPEAFLGISHKGMVYPGQRLIFFDREIWGLSSKSPTGDIPLHTLTGLVCPASPKTLLESCVIRPISRENGDVVKVHDYLKTPRRRKKTAQVFWQDAEGTGCVGLYLPWSSVAPVDGNRYLKLLKRLRRLLKPPVMLWVELGPSIPSWKLWGGVDYATVSNLVDRVVLDLPVPLEPGPLFERSRSETLVETLLPSVHSWKILLKVPVYAMLWESSAEDPDGFRPPSRLPYQTALSRAFRHGARLSHDAAGLSYYMYKQRGVVYHIRLPHHGLIGDVSAVANRHNLAGLVLDELGLEDPRIWQTLNRHFRTADLTNTKG